MKVGSLLSITVVLILALIGSLFPRETTPSSEDLVKAVSARRACTRFFTRRHDVFEGRDHAEVCLNGRIDQSLVSEFSRISIVRHEILVLESPGGDVESALRIAEQVHKLDMSVVVPGLCASACANYLFVAGAKKFVLPGGVVGFHGAPNRDSMIHYSGPDDDRPVAVAAGRRYVDDLVGEQDRLYGTIGVSQRLLHERPGRFPMTPGATDSSFWCWSEQALRVRFHVQGIVSYAQPPEASFVERVVPLLRIFSCQALDRSSWACTV